MLTLTMRPYQGETDLPPLADLLNLCRKVDQIDYTTSVQDLRSWFNAPKGDPKDNVRLWENETGQIVGYSHCQKGSTEEVEDVFFRFVVHPNLRNQGLEEDMLAWGERRVVEIGKSLIRTSTRNTNRDRQHFLETNGYQLHRRFFSMERSLHLPIPEPSVPDGFSIRLYKGESEAEAWVEMFNQSFIDHWNFNPCTLEEQLYYIQAPDYQADMDWVAVSPNGQLAAFCYCNIDKEDNRQRNCQEGWVNLLGTRRGFRRQGLGRAILLTGLHSLQKAGMKVAKLGVDSTNPNGALQLYESVGFQLLHTNLIYGKALGN
ncbi:GNAT family N-acetyltransferase [Roseofilum capinflatum]|uniref:GNAT family N-acetyltransferase n=1 Tax=Roseofilum capinflatum BLCC-M114 TaxID=3022440 RepID=A0ABT7B874_9CYAN|nr:GNAT family N-acetyltransferase [Roseofilum capinflatum]MDJ1175380.1 GNAT family N-acetyltransferase [Roseofilum capinflatum BLCC-M114]